MEIRAEYDALKARYPEHVAEVERSIRKGKSKHRSDPFESFEWMFNFGVIINQSYSLADVIAGKNTADLEAEAAMSETEKIADYASRCRVGIQASKGRGRWFSEQQLPETPEEVLGPYREQLRKEAAEQARIASLSPEQLQDEREAILRELRKSRGFIEVTMPDFPMVAGED